MWHNKCHSLLKFFCASDFFSLQPEASLEIQLLSFLAMQMPRTDPGAVGSTHTQFLIIKKI
jgi:hypothetical protein